MKATNRRKEGRKAHQGEVYRRDEQIMARSIMRASPAEKRAHGIAMAHAHIDMLRSAIPKK